MVDLSQQLESLSRGELLLDGGSRYSEYQRAHMRSPELPHVPSVRTDAVEAAVDTAVDAVTAYDDVLEENADVLGDLEPLAEAQHRAAARAAIQTGKDPAKVKSPLDELRTRRGQTLGQLDVLHGQAAKAIRALRDTVRAEAVTSGELAAQALTRAEQDYADAYARYRAATSAYQQAVMDREHWFRLGSDQTTRPGIVNIEQAFRDFPAGDCVRPDQDPGQVIRSVRQRLAARGLPDPYSAGASQHSEPSASSTDSAA